MTNLIPSRPQSAEFAPFYANYVALVSEDDILSLLASQLEDALALLGGLPEATALTRHAPYTWSIKQVVGHLTDAEREFGHRAFRFSRNDPTPLPGFDDKVYVENAPFEACHFDDLLAEFEFVRRGNLALFRHLPSQSWQMTGTANGTPISVRALAFIIAGHARHHLNILRKRLGAD
jgi:hypothetical protein